MDKNSGCRMTGGICACRSGGSFGGCAKERSDCCTNEPNRAPVSAPTAGGIDLAHCVLEWNRAQAKPPIEIGKEYFVAQQIEQMLGARSAGDAVRPSEIRIPEGPVLRYETRTTGKPGWLLYHSNGELVRAMSVAEVALIEASLAAGAARQGGITSDSSKSCAAAPAPGNTEKPAQTEKGENA